MIGIIISAAFLCVIMYMEAKHEADYSFPKVLLISIGLSICNIILSIMLGPWIALIIVLGLTVWALHQFCYLRWSMAGIVTGLYIAAQIVLGIILGALTY